MKQIRQQPVMFWGNVTALIEGAIGSALVFELVDWGPAEVGAIMIVVANIGLVLSFFLRGKVTPIDNPRDHAGQSLTPGPIGSDDPPVLPPS